MKTSLVVTRMLNLIGQYELQCICIIRYLTRSTRQEPLTLSELVSSPPVFKWVNVAQSLVIFCLIVYFQFQDHFIDGLYQFTATDYPFDGLYQFTATDYHFDGLYQFTATDYPFDGLYQFTATDYHFDGLYQFTATDYPFGIFKLFNKDLVYI